jgi:hypothetical protein
MRLLVSLHALVSLNVLAAEIICLRDAVSMRLLVSPHVLVSLNVLATDSCS